MILIHHGTISWAEDAEPPFPGKVHIILEDDVRDQNSCRIPCGSANWAPCGWYSDFTDGPVTCKSCLQVRPETIERLKREMEVHHARE